MAVAWLALRVMVPVIPTTGLRAAYPEGTAIAIDRVVWLFAMAVSALSGIGFGLSPALAAARRPLVETIRDGTPGMSAGRRHRTLRQLLVVAEVALAFVLLTGAGLLIQSFFTLRQRIDAGFDRTSVLTASLPMPRVRVLTGAHGQPLPRRDWRTRSRRCPASATSRSPTRSRRRDFPTAS